MVELTPEIVSKLAAAATEAKTFAYAPYSKFRVGAALLVADSEEIILGANVENASYGGTICAERTAIVKAVSSGIKKFSAIAVITDIASPVSPCGICRQFIREFCTLDTPIVMLGVHHENGIAKDQVKIVTLGDLLPYSFGPEELEKPRE